MRSMMPNRLSYFLKLKGPSMVTDTACSSSLYALENAYNAMRNGLCDMAIVGGSNLCLHPFVSLQFARYIFSFLVYTLVETFKNAMHILDIFLHITLFSFSQYFRLGVLSNDGCCKSFDNSGNGYCRSEAISCILLQKTKDSRRIYSTVMTKIFKHEIEWVENIFWVSIEPLTLSHIHISDSTC